MKAVIALGPTAMSATGGTETAVGTSFLVPKGTRCIEGVYVSYCAASTHDAGKAHIPKLRIYSQDLKIEPCDILVEGTGSMLTNADDIGNPMLYYPLNIECEGGETIYFYGQVLVTVTTAGWMGITIVLNDTGLKGPRYYYKVDSATTATVTTTLVKTKAGQTFKITGVTKITGVYGCVWQTTAAAATGINGKFWLESNDFKIPFGLSWMNEPAHSLLLAGGVTSRLSMVDELEIETAKETTLQASWENGATNIVGAFIVGVQFIK